MTFEWIGLDGGVNPLPAPLRLQTDREEGAPAASLEAVFPFVGELPEGIRLRVREGTALWFEGIADLARHTLGRTRKTLIRAREPAGLLLDSEALPGTYAAPSFPALFEACGKPYGFLPDPGIIGTPFVLPYTVEKGMSEWEAMETFCLRYLGAPLRAEGWTLRTGRKVLPVLLLDPKRLPVLEETRSHAFYQRLSEVWDQTTAGWTVSQSDPETKRLGILRRRLSTASEERMRKAREATETAAVLLAGRIGGEPGQAARLWGEPGWTVTAARYTRAETGETTRLLLRKG